MGKTDLRLQLAILILTAVSTLAALLVVPEVRYFLYLDKAPKVTPHAETNLPGDDSSLRESTGLEPERSLDSTSADGPLSRPSLAGDSIKQNILDNRKVVILLLLVPGFCAAMSLIDPFATICAYDDEDHLLVALSAIANLALRLCIICPTWVILGLFLHLQFPWLNEINSVLLGVSTAPSLCGDHDKKLIGSVLLLPCTFLFTFPVFAGIPHLYLEILFPQFSWLAWLLLLPASWSVAASGLIVLTLLPTPLKEFGPAKPRPGIILAACVMFIVLIVTLFLVVFANLVSAEGGANGAALITPLSRQGQASRIPSSGLQKEGKVADGKQDSNSVLPGIAPRTLEKRAKTIESSSRLPHISELERTRKRASSV